MNKVEMADRVEARNGLNGVVVRQVEDGAFAAIPDLLAAGAKFWISRVVGLWASESGRFKPDASLGNSCNSTSALRKLSPVYWVTHAICRAAKSAGEFDPPELSTCMQNLPQPMIGLTTQAIAGFRITMCKNGSYASYHGTSPRKWLCRVPAYGAPISITRRSEGQPSINPVIAGKSTRTSRYPKEGPFPQVAAFGKIAVFGEAQTHDQ